MPAAADNPADIVPADDLPQELRAGPAGERVPFDDLPKPMQDQMQAARGHGPDQFPEQPREPLLVPTGKEALRNWTPDGLLHEYTHDDGQFTHTVYNIKQQQPVMEEALSPVQYAHATAPIRARPQTAAAAASPAPTGERSLLGGIGAGLARGIGGMAKAAGGLVDMASLNFQREEGAGSLLRQGGGALQELTPPSTSVAQGGAFQPANWRWWTEGTSEMLPTLATQVGGLIASSGASAPQQFWAFAGPAVGKAAGESYNSAIARGANPAMAMTEATLNGVAATALQRFNIAPLLANSTTKQIFQNAVMNRLAQIGTKAGAEGATNAIAGVAQAATEDTLRAVAENDPEAFKDWQSRYAGAAAQGLGTGAVLGGLHAGRERGRMDIAGGTEAPNPFPPESVLPRAVSQPRPAAPAEAMTPSEFGGYPEEQPPQTPAEEGGLKPGAAQEISPPPAPPPAPAPIVGASEAPGPGGEVTQEKPTLQAQGEAAAKAHGISFDGVTEVSGGINRMNFSDPLSRSTFLVKDGGDVAAALARSRTANAAKIAARAKAAEEATAEKQPATPEQRRAQLRDMSYREVAGVASEYNIDTRTMSKKALEDAVMNFEGQKETPNALQVETAGSLGAHGGGDEGAGGRGKSQGLGRRQPGALAAGAGESAESAGVGGKEGRGAAPENGAKLDEGVKAPGQMTHEELIARYKPGNPFAERAATARRNYERENAPSARDEAMKKSFPLGGGFGNKQGRASIEGSINRAKRVIEWHRKMGMLENQAEAFDAGRINAQGRTIKRGTMRAQPETAAPKTELSAMKWHELEAQLRQLEAAGQGPRSSFRGRSTWDGSERYQAVKAELDKKLDAQRAHAEAHPESFGEGVVGGQKEGPNPRAPGFKTPADKGIKPAPPEKLGAEVHRLEAQAQQPTEWRGEIVGGMKPSGIQKLKEFMRTVPEFKIDPAFTVTADGRLRFRDGGQYTFKPEAIGITGDAAWKPEERIRIDPDAVAKAKATDSIRAKPTGESINIHNREDISRFNRVRQEMTPEQESQAKKLRPTEFSRVFRPPEREAKPTFSPETHAALADAKKALGNIAKGKRGSLMAGFIPQDLADALGRLAFHVVKDLASKGSATFTEFVKRMSDLAEGQLRGKVVPRLRSLYEAVRQHPDSEPFRAIMDPAHKIPGEQADVKEIAKLSQFQLDTRKALAQAEAALPEKPPTETQILRDEKVPKAEVRQLAKGGDVYTPQPAGEGTKATIRRETGQTDESPMVSEAQALRAKFKALAKALGREPTEAEKAAARLYDTIGPVKPSARKAPSLAAEINQSLGMHQAPDPFADGRIDPQKQTPAARDALTDIVGSLRQKDAAATGTGKLADFILSERDAGHSNDGAISEPELATLRALEGKPVDQMTAEQLDLLDRSVRHAAFLGEQYNDSLAHSRIAQVNAQRDEMIGGMKKYHAEPIKPGTRGGLTVEPRRNPIANFVGNVLRDPFRFLKLNLGGGGEKMWRRLADGQTQSFEAVDRAQDALKAALEKQGITPDQWRAMTREARTVQIPGFRALQFSPRELIDFINGWGRAGTRRDMQRAGIVPKRLKGERLESVKINEADAQKIIDAATPAEKEIARVMQEQMAKGELHDAVNAASVREWGFEKATEGDYWPRARAFDQAPRAVAENLQQFHEAMLKDMGVFKEAPGHATAPVLIQDAGDVFDRHISQTARFAYLNDATRDMMMIMNDPAFGEEMRSRIGRQFGRQLTDTLQRLTGMEDSVDIPGAKVMAAVRSRIATGELFLRLTSALNHFLGGGLASNKIPEGSQAAFWKNFALKAVPDMTLIRDMESRNGYLRRRGTQSGASLESPVDSESPPKGRFGRALDALGQAGTAHIRLSDRMDSAAVYKTMIERYHADHPGGGEEAARDWAARETEFIVRQTGTASTPFENSYFAQRVSRVPGLNLLTLFQSKTSAMRNAIDEAYQDWRVEKSPATTRRLVSSVGTVAAMLATYAGIQALSSAARRGFQGQNRTEEKKGLANEAANLAAHVADVLAPGVGGTAVRDIRAAVGQNSQNADIVTETAMKATKDFYAAIQAGHKGDAGAAAEKAADLLNGAGKFFGVSAEQPTQIIEGMIHGKKKPGQMRRR